MCRDLCQTFRRPARVEMLAVHATAALALACRFRCVAVAVVFGFPLLLFGFFRHIPVALVLF